jgi:hypothetical protein
LNRAVPVGVAVKKRKWPAWLTWERIVTSIVFLALMWLVTHIPAPPG